METYIPLLRQTALFNGVNEKETEALLQHMEAKKRRFDKGNFVFYAGDDINVIGIMLSGLAHIVQEDYWETVTFLQPFSRDSSLVKPLPPYLKLKPSSMSSSSKKVKSSSSVLIPL